MRLLAAVLIVLATMCTAWGVNRAGAQVPLPQPHTSRFIVGLSFGQTARITVFNHGQERGLIVDWRFVDSDGNVLSESVGRQPDVVEAHQMKSFEINRDFHKEYPGEPFTGRLQIRGEISSLGGPDTTIDDRA